VLSHLSPTLEYLSASGVERNMHILETTKTSKKTLGGWLALAIGLVVLTALFFLPNLAFAADTWEDTLLEFVWGLVTKVFGLFVAIGGLLLNAGVNLFVVNFGLQYTQSGLGFVVDEVWVYIRDIFNLTFIFGLLYIGFKLILDSSNSSTKRWLVLLILAALLVNFSLFITKFVIDFANIAGTQLVTSGFEAQLEEDAPDWLPIAPGVTPEWYDVSGVFAELMGLPTLYGGSSERSIILAEDNLSWSYIFGSMILFIVAGVVFAAGGLMLLVRFVVLNIYMLLSPVMFIGWVFPQFVNITNSYWRGFLGQAFFAPAYILMIYFSFRLLQGYQIGRQTNLAEVFNSDPETGGQISAAGQVIGSLAFFLIVIGFLVAAIVVSKKLSEMGANGTMGAVKSVNDRIIRTTRKAAMAPLKAGGKVAGAAGAVAARRVTSNLGGRLERGLRRMQENQNRLGSAARKLDSSVGRMAKNMKESKFGLSRTAEQVDTDRKSARYAVNSRAERDGNIRRGEAAVQRLSQNQYSNAADRARDEDARDKMMQTASSVSFKEFESMSDDQQENLVGHINDSTFSKVMDSEKISDEAKDKLLKARQDSIKSTVSAGRSQTNYAPDKLLSGEVEKLSDSQIETMDEEFIRDNAHLFSETQMKALDKSKKFNSTQKANFKQARANYFDTYSSSTGMAAGGEDVIFNNPNQDSAQSGATRRKKPTEIASLPRNIITKPEVASRLNSAELRELSKRSDLTNTDRQGIETSLKGNPSNTDGNSYINSSHYDNNWL
jgi:hypothetical protein